ncbi:methyltransferase domain-containing protein [Scenedesmus sp. NREL 46B-D3]|nr:methyltransferase domain-containing protein [Scenedesmus sp. NREL 46B-D3]
MTPTTGFTTDWFSANIPSWQQWLSGLAGRPGLRALEVGSWEGRSATWLLEHVLTDPSSHLTCIDLWQTGNVLERFAANMAPWLEAGRLTMVRDSSYAALPRLEHGAFDIVYVDASHTSHSVLEDAVLAWRLLKPGGIMIFDDYLGGNTASADESVHQGVVAFCHCYGSFLSVIGSGYQLAIRKRSEVVTMSPSSVGA